MSDAAGRAPCQFSFARLSGPAYGQGTFMIRASVMGLLLLVAWALVGCSGGYCQGPDCGCNGRSECIIACPQDGCDLSCQRASNECGAICGDDCSFTCNDTNHCSTLAGDRANIDCRNLPHCAAECGAECRYSAQNVNDVYLTVGPGSEVTCRNLVHCNVTCQGECSVTCTDLNECNVDCRSGTSLQVAGAVRRCE